MAEAGQGQSRMTASERRIVTFTSVAHGLNHAVELVYGAVLVVVAFEFDASLAVLGAVANASARLRVHGAARGPGGGPPGL
jgi:hypothetical protein